MLKYNFSVFCLLNFIEYDSGVFSLLSLIFTSQPLSISNWATSTVSVDDVATEWETWTFYTLLYFRYFFVKGLI